MHFSCCSRVIIFGLDKIIALSKNMNFIVSNSSCTINVIDLMRGSLISLQDVATLRCNTVER